MQSLSTIQVIAVWTVPVLFSITLHEAAHAFAAHRCGDNTARMLGRLSMNPIKHIDLLGTVLVPILVAVLSGFQFVFGWAKPVPINWHHLKHPRRDMGLVAAAGPLSNLIMALIWACCSKLGYYLNPNTSNFALFLVLTGEAGVLINLVLAFLNLIPIPPLDGSRVVTSLLPPKMAYYYQKIEPFGFLIVFALLLTGVLGLMLNPLLSWSIYGIYYLFGFGH